MGITAATNRRDLLGLTEFPDTRLSIVKVRKLPRQAEKGWAPTVPLTLRKFRTKMCVCAHI